MELAVMVRSMVGACATGVVGVAGGRARQPAGFMIKADRLRFESLAAHFT